MTHKHLEVNKIVYCPIHVEVNIRVLLTFIPKLILIIFFIFCDLIFLFVYDNKRKNTQNEDYLSGEKMSTFQINLT